MESPPYNAVRFLGSTSGRHRSAPKWHGRSCCSRTSIITRYGDYEITITNLTRDQQFTPILAVTHNEGVRLFELGAPASEELEILAESGDITPLMTALRGRDGVLDIAASAGLLPPGESVTLQVRAGGNMRHFSLASMLIPTNDAFFAVNGSPLPRGRRLLTIDSPVYDAGTERNDETCASIPGPPYDECGGPGLGGSPAGEEEGHVFIHAGIHGIGDFDPARRDWRNPAARINVRRMW